VTNKITLFYWAAHIHWSKFGAAKTERSFTIWRKWQHCRIRQIRICPSPNVWTGAKRSLLSEFTGPAGL